MSPFAKNTPIVGTQFSPTGRIQPDTPALRWHSLRPSLAQLPRTPMVNKLLDADYSNLELRALAHSGGKLAYGQ